MGIRAGHGSRNVDNEWYTPFNIVDMCREVMGGIDLDPATCEDAQRVIKAKTYYTIDDDGLNHYWHGRVFINPPYTNSAASGRLKNRFIDHLAKSLRNGKVTQACLILGSDTSFSGYWRIADILDARWNSAGKIEYWHPAKPRNSPGNGSCILYFGQKWSRFVEVFQRLPGEILIPYRHMHRTPTHG